MSSLYYNCTLIAASYRISSTSSISVISVCQDQHDMLTFTLLIMKKQGIRCLESIQVGLIWETSVIDFF